MIKRLTLGVMLALVTAQTMFAATLPSQATDRLPRDKLPSWAVDTLCTYLGIGCA
jgi:hypothetical protein